MSTTHPTDDLTMQIARALGQRGLQLVTAESCTGGLLAGALTAVPGSSEWFAGGFVTYTERAKSAWLGVAPDTLQRYTAVSEPVAREMALGALQRGLPGAAGISVSVTGIAGPGGGDPIVPVGDVWFGYAESAAPSAAQILHTELHSFEGDRTAVRSQAVVAALRGLARALGMIDASH